MAHIQLFCCALSIVTVIIIIANEKVITNCSTKLTVLTLGQDKTRNGKGFITDQTPFGAQPLHIEISAFLRLRNYPQNLS